MYLLTPPITEPVTIYEAAIAARLSAGDALEPMLAGLISSARQMAEQETGLQIMQQTWRVELECWPYLDQVLHVHRATACAITYWDGAGWALLAGGAYSFYPLNGGTGVAPMVGVSWPTLGAVAGGPRVRIDLTAGETDRAAVPECIKTYIKALVAHWVNNPEASTARALTENPYLSSMLDPVRVWGG